ncbi:hypothetical protein FSARC_2969 [Fusarium sarcochroum]|uniref:Uncharacterized protein n=1 Tax=Fusarium sarcochroum TaxID=1208366 RepID=A0A8H4XD81_9HYPO|nr:hypothetical protein FSARC_2969 [Fusarium sarcochroum]
MAHIFDVSILIDTGYIDGKKGRQPGEPDHRFSPVFEDDIHFNVDGRFLAEIKAKKSLFGRYCNPFTDSELVKSVIRTAANTYINFWRGMLLASEEDRPAYAIDPMTLETIGWFDFEGQIRSLTMTAYPEFDPKTGETICSAYEAGGNGTHGSRQIAVCILDKDGVKTEEAWYEAPFCSMIRDCGVSKNYVVLPMTPLKCNPERLEKGAFHGHVAGCYENEEGNIIFDLTIADGNVFFFLPPEDTPAGAVAKRNRLNSPTKRWIFDPKSPSETRVQATPLVETRCAGVIKLAQQKTGWSRWDNDIVQKHIR